VRQASTLCRKAERAAARGDVALAVPLFERALGAVPGFPDAKLGLGHLAMAAGRFEDALRAYRGAREGFRAMGEAVAELRAERYREAQREIQQVQAEIADMARVHAGGVTGTGAFEATDVSARLQDRLRALQAIPLPGPPSLDPPADVFFHEGVALFRLDRLDEAHAAWTACARLHPGFAAVHRNLAVLEWKAGRFEAALAELDRAETLGFPADPSMRQDLEAAASGR
jgi:tetratricopeptide (TPR) repeat protein